MDRADRHSSHSHGATHVSRNRKEAHDKRTMDSGLVRTFDAPETPSASGFDATEALGYQAFTNGNEECTPYSHKSKLDSREGHRISESSENRLARVGGKS